jgi:hypothetical protein
MMEVDGRGVYHGTIFSALKMNAVAGIAMPSKSIPLTMTSLTSRICGTLLYYRNVFRGHGESHEGATHPSCSIATFSAQGDRKFAGRNGAGGARGMTFGFSWIVSILFAFIAGYAIGMDTIKRHAVKRGFGYFDDDNGFFWGQGPPRNFAKQTEDKV